MPLKHLGCDVVLASGMGRRASRDNAIVDDHWDISGGVCNHYSVTISYLVSIRRNFDVVNKQY